MITITDLVTPPATRAVDGGGTKSVIGYRLSVIIIIY